MCDADAIDMGSSAPIDRPTGVSMHHYYEFLTGANTPKGISLRIKAKEISGITRNIQPYGQMSSGEHS